nr:hypothetical protein [Klebsiella pneumoniae]
MEVLEEWQKEHQNGTGIYERFTNSSLKAFESRSGNTYNGRQWVLRECSITSSMARTAC